ncbi:MAG: ASKHA domain-containing protein [Lachnospiraceae bacterium]|nr:ASKHA domain-containing protein [Lachnospiraceae bacterium]
MARKKTGIAIDIGTTNIVGMLADQEGFVIRRSSRANSGASFGVDVMSRVRAVGDGSAACLKERMQQDLLTVISSLTGDFCEETDAVVLCGNTVMLHLLCGYDCTGLGHFPYHPVSLAAEKRTARELLPQLAAPWSDVPLWLLPGISAFVGADITAGLYEMQERGFLPAGEGQAVLFMDLGTNGEMALIRQQEGRRTITVCSTAAGPVFEGAGIRCGMRGEEGAICSVVLVPAGEGESRVTARCRTIKDAPAAGICGSGVLEAVSELVRMRMIDRDGLLAEPWFSKGFPLAGDEIRIYPEDVRAVQLAKAAIRAGAETLPLACGIPAADIGEILIAGAFGGALPLSRLRPLAMIPPVLTGRCRTVGNSALAGTGRVLNELLNDREDEAFAALDRICSDGAELPLAGRQDFKACYLAMMGFDAD